MKLSYLLDWITIFASCLLYIWPLKPREGFKKRVLALFFGGLLACLFLPLPAEILRLFLYYGLCALSFRLCTTAAPSAALYCGAWAFITQQIPYELWRLASGYAGLPPALAPFSFLLKPAALLLSCAALYAVAGLTVVRFMPDKGRYQIGPRQLTSALLLLLAFETLFVLLMEMEPGRAAVMLWPLLLMQVYLVTILYLQNVLFKKSAMQHELSTLNRLWHEQAKQYELSQKTIALINRKCHDLKHQIAAIRAISSQEEQEKYLTEIAQSMEIYDSIIKTGNDVLDTVLTEKSLLCSASHIKINCIADGRRMERMDPVDIYTIFGNALDNAMESVKAIENRDRRLIDVLVYVKKQFLMINIMNPMSASPVFEDGLPKSTKAKDGYHGFGLKSIRYTAEKYGGFMKIDTAEGIFSLRLLIPLSSVENGGGAGPGRI